MDFETYWNRLVDSAPSLSNDSVKMTMTVSSFKAAMARCYKKGFLESEQRRKAAESFDSVKKKSDPFDLFRDLF